MCHRTGISILVSKDGVKDRNSQNSRLFNQCKLLCCRSCTFCNKICKAAAKERLKSSIKETSRNKICELCFLCRSVCFCPICSQCPQCCSCSTSRRLSTALLADLGTPRSQPKGSINFEGGLRTTIQAQTPTSQRPHDNQWLCRPPEKSLPRGVCTNSSTQEGHRDGEGSNISSLLQQTIHSPKTKPKMASGLGPQCSKQVFEHKNIQDGNPETIRISLQQGEWVSSPIFTSLFTPGPGNTSGSTSKTFPTSSGPSPLASQQLQWSSLGWSKRSS